MGRRSRRGVMSEQFKYELAKDLGFYETVQREGWGGIRTKDAGNMVKRAIQIAEQTLARQSTVPTQPVQTQSAYRLVTQPPASMVPTGYAGVPASMAVPSLPFYAASQNAASSVSSYSH